MRSSILFLFCVLILSSCQYPNRTYKALNEPFDAINTPSPPNYNNPDAWAALPDRTEENADQTPDGLYDEQNLAQADVFWVYPTSFTRKPKDRNVWNADVKNEALNASTQGGSMLYQASIFNGAGKIYAPYYRQAHISTYFVNDTTMKQNIFDIAYSDVKRAFQLYLSRYNRGRPIIIASHSQGTTHATRLLKEFFDGTPLQKQLVAGYLVGMAVQPQEFKALKPCQNANETGCFVSWRTYAAGFYPPNYTKPEKPALCTNPLSWNIDTALVDYNAHKGGLLRNPDRLFAELTDAQCDEDGFLRIHEPKAPIAKLIKFTNYHILDYNLFYVPVRENAKNRVQRWLQNG